MTTAERRKRLLANLPEHALIAEARRLERSAPLAADESTVFAWVLGELFRRHGVALDRLRYDRDCVTLGAVDAALAQLPARAS